MSYLKFYVAILLFLPLTLWGQQSPYFTDNTAAGYANDTSNQQAGYQAPQQPPVLLNVSDQAAVIDDMSKLDNARQLKSSDVISFRIIEEKKGTQKLRIMDSGEVAVPHIGLVTAKGKTMRQLAYIIKTELEREYFRKATVIIALDEAWEQRRNWHNRNQNFHNKGMYNPDTEQITVYGQVGRQGRYNIRTDRPMTISTAILQAGGFARFANKKKVRIYRKIAGDDRNRRIILVNVDRIMRRGELNKDIELRPDDVVIVPEKLINF